MQNFQYKWTLYAPHSLLRVAIDEKFYAHLKKSGKMESVFKETRQRESLAFFKDWVGEEWTKSFGSFLRLNPSTVVEKFRLEQNLLRALFRK